jgi:hypothetical protein
MIGDSNEPIPQEVSMWCTIMCSHTHSRDASNNAIISEWLVDVATIVYLDDFQDKGVPPCMKTNPVCDLASWGSDK